LKPKREKNARRPAKPRMAISRTTREPLGDIIFTGAGRRAWVEAGLGSDVDGCGFMFREWGGLKSGVGAEEGGIWADWWGWADGGDWGRGKRRRSALKNNFFFLQGRPALVKNVTWGSSI
jgi:hypothetical protein